MKPKARFAVWAMFCALLCLGNMRLAPSPALTLEHNTVFTATNEVSSLALEPDGTLWVATMGGILRRNTQGEWRKWTRQDGLPALTKPDASRLKMGS